MQVVLAEVWAQFERVARPILRTSRQGADTFVWLAAAGVPNCRFWHDRRPRPAHYLPFTRESPAERRALRDYAEASGSPA